MEVKHIVIIVKYKFIVFGVNYSFNSVSTMKP